MQGYFCSTCNDNYVVRSLNERAMLAIFSKKKISEEKFANVLANSLLELTEKGFADVADLINDDPAFEKSPDVDPTDDKQFLMIIIAGNLDLLTKMLESGQDRRVRSRTVSKLAEVFAMKSAELDSKLAELHGFMKRVNHPSKNTLYAMNKAVFFKYDLNAYQEDYFRNMKTPNPLFLSRLNDVMRFFLWDWNAFLEDYKITN